MLTNLPPSLVHQTLVAVNKHLDLNGLPERSELAVAILVEHINERILEQCEMVSIVFRNDNQRVRTHEVYAVRMGNDYIACAGVYKENTLPELGMRIWDITPEQWRVLKCSVKDNPYIYLFALIPNQCIPLPITRMIDSFLDAVNLEETTDLVASSETIPRRRI